MDGPVLERAAGAMSMDTDDITLGVILAGGASRRMGGDHKGLMEIGGAPMLQHVADRLAPQVAELAISVHGAGDAFRRFGLPLITDAASEQHGPLAGVHAGMGWASASRPEARWIVTAPCDAPFCPRDLVARLRAGALAAPADVPRIAIAASNGRSHFAFGLWPIALGADLEAYLGAGERRMQGWIERHAHIAVEFPLLRHRDQTLDPFFNVNTPADIDTARTFLADFGSQ
jgi:molybdopterin-guanine dinucleotide biosynthesis protein A